MHDPNGDNGQRSILVVEDDREINELIGAYTQIAGFEYRPALDGTTALREAHARVPAAVVLDLMLPDIDGFEICQRLKTETDTRGVPIIILTALGGEANRKRGHACGAAEYLLKPFDPDKLMEALSRCAEPRPG
ncbi:MAG TPA: response regulator [Tepidisphaeraceae bacterium]|nr:response regulator [Tepidisphaeraceae bacterium]